MSKFWLIAILLLFKIGVVYAQGATFNDIFNVFKVGFIDNIAGSWFLGGLIIFGISLWLGISLGLNIASIIAIFIPLSLTLIATAILPMTLSFILAILITIFVYVIYIKLFRR